MSTTDDKSDKKVQDYKKRIREIEEENEHITVQLAKARHHIKRLRIERIVLLDEIDDLRRGGGRSNGVGSHIKKSNGIHSGIGGAGDESDSEMSVSESVMSESRGPSGKKGRGAGVGGSGGTVATASGTSTSTAQRKKRDPNAPKGPGNVFFLYCRMERDSIKDEVPNESLGEVTRLLGQKWKALTKEQKQKYYDLYRKEMEEYETAMKSYTAAGGGAEGAAAVAAAAAAQQQEEEKLKQEIKSKHHDGEGEEAEEDAEEEEEEEIDMLQDEDDEEMGHSDEDLAAVLADEETGSISPNAISTTATQSNNDKATHSSTTPNPISKTPGTNSTTSTSTTTTFTPTTSRQ
ncbi:hypothetical protein BDF20DRAFT_908636 [Mycotypha africana]|uniref:uncharacterized protein n=1 Tax=Mycotypha africana TaxID=64632 RepID=UPI0023003EA0|nr:uncharacterized protein BDF20DRAFT_908636 [Mycotypha africana]KAI8990786.1 hypothetical protein BDF20DRAFT_908636 [Mycotypha africana]